MSYPSFEEYTDALRMPPGDVFEDPVLASGTVRRNGAGVPFARSGNFALTYEVAVNGSRYAVRCFHKESDSLDRRYAAISRKLTAIASPWFVEFDFQPAGIRTESGQYPIVRMQWADGCSLAQFISEHRDEPQTLLTLRETLRELARHLQAHDIAHGDIQPGNIMVRSATELKLVDYDGMFVPELEPWGSTELGQRNFQHPGRSWLHYDERLDRFSFALLDVALEALAMQPALWELTGSDEAGIVLRASDFVDPAASTAFGVLAQLDGLAPRARQLAAVCRSAFERVPALDDFLAGRRIPAASAVTLGAVSATAKRAYIPAYAVLNATNFARCCAHIGDRIELIGRVRRVARESGADTARMSLRVEFGDAREDMVRLSIWPEASGAAQDAPGALEPGQWLSAIGLVDPILTETSGDRTYKSVSIAITEPSQLRLLTEREALHRLAADEGPSRADQDIAVTIGTDPAIPGIVGRPVPPFAGAPDATGDAAHITETVVLPSMPETSFAAGDMLEVDADPAVVMAPVLTTPVEITPVMSAPASAPAEPLAPARDLIRAAVPPAAVPATIAEPQPTTHPEAPASAMGPHSVPQTPPPQTPHAPPSRPRASAAPAAVVGKTRGRIDWRLMRPSPRWPSLRWPSLRWPSPRWPSPRWPSLHLPPIRWPEIRRPVFRPPTLSWPPLDTLALRLRALRARATPDSSAPARSARARHLTDQLSHRLLALRQTLATHPPLMPRILDTLPQLRAAARRASIPPTLALRLRSIHPAWWVAAVLMAVVLAQSWIIARKSDVPIVVAGDDPTPAATPSARAGEERRARGREGEPIASDRAADTRTRDSREPSRPGRAESAAAPASGAATTLAGGGPRAAQGNRLLAFEDLRSARRPIATIAGPIDVVTRTGPPRSTLVAVNGRTLNESRAPFNVLTHRSVYADREVIVGFSDCASGTAACERKEPFWLLLRKSQAPEFKRSAGLRANKSAGAVTAVPSGVHVDLGVWDGVRQTATLTSLDDIYVTRVREAPAPLSGADCRTVAAALESCAASRDCGSYESITRSVPTARMAQIRRLFHESTGLNAPMFRSVCVRACELGLTPTSALVRREVCGGAAPGQWAQVSLDGD